MNNNTKSKRRRQHKAGELGWCQRISKQPKVARSAAEITDRLLRGRSHDS